MLNENYIDLGISIDGDRETHDNCRKDAEGNGTYDIVVRNIQKTLYTEKYSRNLKELWGLVVITSGTNSLVDILKHHKATGLKSVQMKNARLQKDKPFAVNEDNIEKIEAMYSEFTDFFRQEASIGRIDYLTMILNDNDFYGKLIRRLLLKERIIYRCDAGKCKFSVNAAGEIYPCDSFVGHSEFKLGDIYSGIDPDKQEKFYRASIFDREKCKECWAKFLCGGDCFYNSYIVNGNITEPDKIHCRLIKFCILQSLELIDFFKKY